MLRRVESQRVVMDATLRHLVEKGDEAHRISAAAAVRRVEHGVAQGAVYFNGQDEPHPSGDTASVAPTSYDDPGARVYRLARSVLDQSEGTGTLTGVLGLHEVNWVVDGDDAVFSMAQRSKNVIPLLLDSRADRSTADATAVY